MSFLKQPDPAALDYRAHFPLWIRVIAQVVSVVFHPVFMLPYGLLVLAWSNPILFGKLSFAQFVNDGGLRFLLLQFFFLSTFIPIFSVLLMRGLNLVSNVTLPDRQERIGPYVLVGLCYIVLFMQINQIPYLPLALRVFTLGATIALFVAFIINLFSKISTHTVGMGGLVAVVIISLINSGGFANNLYLFPLVVFCAGLVGTARRILGAHVPAEVYGGYFIGFLSQFVAISVLVGGSPPQ